MHIKRIMPSITPCAIVIKQRRKGAEYHIKGSTKGAIKGATTGALANNIMSISQ